MCYVAICGLTQLTVSMQTGHQQVKTVSKDSSDNDGAVEEGVTPSWLGGPRRLQKNASFVSSNVEEDDKIEEDVTNPWLGAARRLQHSLNSFSSALSQSVGNQEEGAASNMASQHEHETVPALQVRPEQI